MPTIYQYFATYSMQGNDHNNLLTRQANDPLNVLVMVKEIFRVIKMNHLSYEGGCDTQE